MTSNVATARRLITYARRTGWTRGSWGRWVSPDGQTVVGYTDWRVIVWRDVAGTPVNHLYQVDAAVAARCGSLPDAVAVLAGLGVLPPGWDANAEAEAIAYRPARYGRGLYWLHACGQVSLIADHRDPTTDPEQHCVDHCTAPGGEWTRLYEGVRSDG